MTHPIPREALAQSVAIVGRTGSGKSYTARGAVELLLVDGARVCIIDPTGVWHGLRSSADGQAAGFPVVVFGGDHGDVAIADTSGAALAELIATRNLPAVIDLSEFSRAGMTRFMGPFLETLYSKTNRQPLTLVVDEADLFAPQQPAPETRTLLGRMEQVARRGRVRGFRPWMITQRPASLNKNVLSQANTLIAMQLTAPQDRDAIGAWIEGQADRDEGKKLLAALPKLQRGEGFVWSPSHDLLERVHFPRIRTFDSSRTPEEGETLSPTALADVDLSGIAESLAAVEEEAARDDPKELRRQITDLRRQIADLKSELDEPRELAVDEEVLAIERRAGKLEGYGEAIKALMPMIDRMQTLRLALDEQLGGLVLDLTGWRHRFAEADAPQNANTSHEPVTAAPIVAKHPRQIHHPREAAKAGTNGSGAALPRAERLILTALAQYPSGRSKNQVAILTGYAVNGGGFTNSISSARTKGYLEGDAARLVITPGGVAALGHFEPLPQGRALLEHWYGQLGRAERKALESLAEVYPRSLSKSQLASRAGYEANGGGFNNALSRLRTLELISGRADIKASADLFG